MERILRPITQLWKRFESLEHTENWVREIYRDDQPLITRYYIFSTRWLEDIAWLKPLHFLSFRLVLHHMHQSDEDGLHDHPWLWASWILSGGYWEETPEGKFWRWPGHLRFRPSKSFHRLVLDPNTTRKGVYSLFWMGPRRGGVWGFLDRDGNWRPWFQHIEEREKERQL